MIASRNPALASAAPSVTESTFFGATPIVGWPAWLIPQKARRRFASKPNNLPKDSVGWG